MKKAIALLMASMLLIAMFAACQGSDPAASPTPPPTTSATTTPSADPGAATPTPDASADPVAATLPYGELPHGTDNLAVDAEGNLKYELDPETNYPTGWYEYELPLTTAGDTFTAWTTSFVSSYIPAEGLETMDYHQYLRNETGVNIEFTVGAYASEGLQTSFSLMMASQDYTDIVSSAYQYWNLGGGGAARNMIDEGFFVNIADYVAYAPNFLNLEPTYGFDTELHNLMWFEDDLIISMGYLLENQLPGTGWVIRQDWLDRLDGAPTAEEMDTYAEFEDVLTRFKNEIIPTYDYGNLQGYPYLPARTIENMNSALFGGMNTTIQFNTVAPANQATRVLPKTEPSIFSSSSDKVITFTLMDNADYQALDFFLDWQEKGLLNPEYQSYTDNPLFNAEISNQRAGLFTTNPSVLEGFKVGSTDPNMSFAALKNPTEDGVWDSKYGNQYRHYGYFRGWGWSFSAAAENIPLLISYADWFYSENGSMTGTWGIEGINYEFDDNGNQVKTDFVINNSLGMSPGEFMWLYSQNAFADPIRQNHLANYAYPAGEYQRDMFYIWAETIIWMDDPSVDHWNWPSAAAAMTPDQVNETSTYMTDANTWLVENYAMFLDGSTPLTEETWKTYSDGIVEQGYGRLQLVMQQVYEDYINSL